VAVAGQAAYVVDQLTQQALPLLEMVEHLVAVVLGAVAQIAQEQAAEH
jgi:hypothetical protein